MKKVLSFCLVAAMLFGLGSCTKEAPNQGGQNPYYVPGGTTNPPGGGVDPEPTPTSPVGDVPSTFTKKIIIEKMTGEWCGACPNGGTVIDGIVSSNAGKVFAAAWQMSNGDPFEIPEAKTWRSHISAGAGVSSFSFPSASVNRAPSISSNYMGAALDVNSGGNWATQTSTALAKKAECGLALVTSEESDKIDVDVYVGFNNAITTSNTYVTVYLIEDDVPESSVGAQSGAPDGYKHKHMVRDVLTAELGDAVDLTSTTADKYVKLEIKGFDIAGKYHDKKNLKILAFVNIKESKADQLDVLNAQEVDLGETQKFD